MRASVHPHPLKMRSFLVYPFGISVMSTFFRGGRNSGLSCKLSSWYTNKYMTKKKLFDHITVDPKVRFGKPVIDGTRVPVDMVVGKIAGGMTVEEVMDEYNLTKQQVMAALRYAAELVAQEEITFA